MRRNLSRNLLKGPRFTLLLAATLGGSLILVRLAAAAAASSCGGLPSHAALKSILQTVVAGGNNGGLGNDMWATVVNRDGVVCAVVFTGADRGSQWPGSRIISAQKANTANAFSRPAGVIGFAGALSTANLFAAVQPGGSLFGLQHSNPVDAELAYDGNSGNYGQPNDPLVGGKIGGVNVFGGGLALYNPGGALVGGLGVSGDTSCSDHIIAWKVRHGLNLDNVPAGVSADSDDNIIFSAPAGSLQAAFVHPNCSPVGDPKTIAENLPISHPIGPNP
jgi:uncharacterized protein GlcG (DUF336 family)